MDTADIVKVTRTEQALHRHWMTLVERGDDPHFIAALIEAACAFEPRLGTLPEPPPLIVTRFTGHGLRHHSRPDVPYTRGRV